MRRLRLRLSVRGLMALVALVSLAFGVVVWRRVDFTRRAEYHEARIAQVGEHTRGRIRWWNQKGGLLYDEETFPGYNDISDGIPRPQDAPPRIRRYWDRLRSNQDWHKAMKQKYLRASARPWLLVAPDPPEPPLPNGPDAP